MKNGILSIVGAGLLILLASCAAPAAEQASTASPLAAVSTASPTAIRPSNTVPPRPSATSTPQPTATEYHSPTASPISAAFPYLANPLPEGAVARLGNGPLMDAVISPDGNLLAATSTTGVRVYRLDRESGAAEEIWFGPTSTGLISAAFSADGKILATGGIGRTDGDSGCNPLTYDINNGGGGGVQLWDAASGEPLLYFGQTGYITALEFSPDGKTLAASNQYGDVMLWDLETGQSTALDLTVYPGVVWPQEWWVYDMAFSPDGATLAVGGMGDGKNGDLNSIELWDWRTGRFLVNLAGLSDFVLGVSYSPDGKILASGTKDGMITLWDPGLGTIIRKLAGSGTAVNELAFSPDGGTLASGSEDGSIALWDAAAGTRKRTLHGHALGIVALRFSPDGAALAAADDSPDIIDWDPASGKLLHTFTIAGYSLITSMAVSPDQKFLASGDSKGRILLWDLSRREPVLSLQGHASWIYSLAFSPDGKRLASGSEDHRVILWDAAGGKSSVLNGHTERVKRVAFSPDGSILASAGGDHIIILWDPATGKKLRVLQGNPGIAFSPDGKILASSSPDYKEIILWNPTNGGVIGRFAYVKFNPPLVFSPDGSMLAAANGAAVTLFAVSDGMEIHQPDVDAYYSMDLAFSPDGRIGAVAAFTVNLWDIASGEAIRSLAGHTCWTRNVAFSPDGKTVFSGSYDGTILIWDLEAILPDLLTP
jgi:WD40 repeat protein